MNSFLASSASNSSGRTAAYQIVLRRLFFGAKTRARTWRLVADLIDAGLQLSDALETAADVARDQGSSAAAEVLIDIRDGIPRAELGYRASLYTPGSEALMFQVVESGDAERIFRSAMRLAEQREKLSRAIWGAIMQPLVLFLLLGVVYYMLGTALYPELARIAPMSTWPLFAQSIGGFSLWFSRNVFSILLFAAAVIVGFRFLLERWTMPPRHIADRFLPFSLYKMQAGCGFIFTITELGRMGVTLNSDLLHQMSATASPYLKSRVEAVARALEIAGWGEALKSTGHDFPARDLNAVMGALNGREDWIEKFAGFLDRWLEDFDAMVRSRTAVLNLLLLAFVALAIGGTMFSTLSIMQSLQ
jgi:type II secretory pathway component PulF